MAAQQIPSGTYLLPHDYYVMDLSDYLNNTGDDVNLLGTDGLTLFDSYPYSSSNYDLSYCRYPDGDQWYAGCTATKEAANVH